MNAWKLQGERGGAWLGNLEAWGLIAFCLALSLCACPAVDVGAGGESIKARRNAESGVWYAQNSPKSTYGGPHMTALRVPNPCASRPQVTKPLRSVRLDDYPTAREANQTMSSMCIVCADSP